MQQGEIALRDAPDPAECQVAPRTLANIRELGEAAASAPAVPVVEEIPYPNSTPVLPEGSPADANTVAGVQGVIREMVACSNARDTLRRMALFSDANVGPAFPEGPTAAFVELAAAPATALPVESRIAVVNFGETRLMADGRVAMSVVLDNPSYHSHSALALQNPTTANQQVAVAILVRENDQWRIDEMIY
jgi:hypothetical protein